jgi:hypothetical protein
VGVDGQRPLGSFDRRKCKGPLNGPQGHRRSLSRGLVVLSVPGPRASRASARTAPSRATTRGSISTTRSGSARTCRCPRPTSTTAWSRSRTAR